MKIHKRKGLFDECVDADVAKSGRKHPKVRKVNRGATQDVFVAVLEI